MGQYKSQYTGPQIDAGINAALNPDVAVTPDSDALVTSGAVAEALENIDPTITSNTDTTLNGILVGDGGKVGAKSLDTSSLTNDADHVPVSSVVKSALNAKADKTDLTTIHQTSPTCTETNGIAAGVFFYLDNELVVAKTAIANGATFTNGTNYESPTAGGLNALKSAIVVKDVTFTYVAYGLWTASTNTTGHLLNSTEANNIINGDGYEAYVRIYRDDGNGMAPLNTALSPYTFPCLVLEET